MKKEIVLLTAVFTFIVFTATGCGAKPEAAVGDEPTKYTSQDDLERLTMQAQAKQARAEQAQANSKFSLAKNITPANTTAKDIDSIVRPVLVKTFSDARLVSAKGPEAPKVDGEVVEDRMVYAVKTLLTEPDGDKLREAFRAAGFVASPRLGRKPTHSRGNVYMSVMRSTSLRGYSFVIVVYTDKQRIEVESYKLGSKYDRLM